MDQSACHFKDFENLCICESDVGNTALLCATEKQDYKGIWLKESLSSKSEFTQQISTLWWDRCVRDS